MVSRRDFNEILFDSEKSRCLLRTSSQILEFSDSIDNCGLHDL